MNITIPYRYFEDYLFRSRENIAVNKEDLATLKAGLGDEAFDRLLHVERLADNNNLWLLWKKSYWTAEHARRNRLASRAMKQDLLVVKMVAEIVETYHIDEALAKNMLAKLQTGKPLGSASSSGSSVVALTHDEWLTVVPGSRLKAEDFNAD